MLVSMPLLLPEGEIAPARLIVEIIIQFQGSRGSVPQTCVLSINGSNDVAFFAACQMSGSKPYSSHFCHGGLRSSSVGARY
jgi:hypothetical protein